MKTRFLAYLLLILSPVLTARASVLTPGEDPGQFGLSLFVHNDSDLPYPAFGQIGDGVIRYASDWFDHELATWQAWVSCVDAAGDCDALYDELLSGNHDVDFDDDSLTIGFEDLVQAASFEMFGVTFTQADIKLFRNTFAVDGTFIGTVLDLQTADGDTLDYGAGDEDVNLGFNVAGNIGNCSLGSCNAVAPDGSSTEDIFFDFSIDPEPAESVPEPPSTLLWLAGLAGMFAATRPRPAVSPR